MKEILLDDNVSLLPSVHFDLPDLLKVCLKTANSGSDATHLHNLHDLVGEIYVAPYILYEPEFAFTLKAKEKVVGYVLGVLDTARFEIRLETEYWPKIQDKYAQITEGLTPHDIRLIKKLGKQGFSTPELIAKYPSHLHIDIIESHQGLGYGKLMMKHLFKELKNFGSIGVHLHMSSSNNRAKVFYERLDFVEVDVNPHEIIMGLSF
jgi:ribosomal protein S18 acetylase RimI-like enzyme